MKEFELSYLEEDEQLMSLRKTLKSELLNLSTIKSKKYIKSLCKLQQKRDSFSWESTKLGSNRSPRLVMNSIKEEDDSHLNESEVTKTIIKKPADLQSNLILNSHFKENRHYN